MKRVGMTQPASPGPFSLVSALPFAWGAVNGMVKKEGRGWVNTGAVNVMCRMSGDSDRPIDRAIRMSPLMARQ